ncbi:hypothetical protein GXW71_10750 [Roseomonas hellenica]|uniref:2'-5' RNA ligase n=1 Tax=Plastoroseomonas hellenica TaxID=2687306 RepID=A0ABS5EY28_9PROT|nr:hypothetical protein [Plastoroseomonas hellenica]MBR0664830.1 hypothetical protein [Plastoroseomonas hellenica]
MSRSASRQSVFDFGPEAAQALLRRKTEWRRAHPNSVFLAAKPEPDAAAQGMEIVRALCGRRGILREGREEEHLHATIQPIGAYEALSYETRPCDVVAALCAGDMVEARAFRTEFDLLQSFKGERDRRGRPTWKIVLCCRNCAVWMPLVEQIAVALQRAGFPATSPLGFEPHMTLVYRGWQIPTEVLERPVAWTVRSFLLVNSIYGRTTHEHLGQWQLRD